MGKVKMTDSRSSPGSASEAFEAAAQWHDTQAAVQDMHELAYREGVNRPKDIETAVQYARTGNIHRNSARAIRAMALALSSTQDRTR